MDEDTRATLQLEATHDQAMLQSVEVYDSWDLATCEQVEAACRRLASSKDYVTSCVGHLALAGLVETVLRADKREKEVNDHR